MVMGTVMWDLDDEVSDALRRSCFELLGSVERLNHIRGIWLSCGRHL